MSLESGLPKSPANREKTSKNKSEVLRGLHQISSVEGDGDDRWLWDGLKSTEKGVFSYEDTFAPIFNQLSVKSFPELVTNRSHELKRKIQVLDLFGGAYFLTDLRKISKIVGVRLKNVDEFFIKTAGHDPRFDKLVANPRRMVLEGSLYKSEVWNKLREEKGSGFDLIVCRPGGPFGETHNSTSVRDVKDTKMAREEIFIVLLERALKLLSHEGGILFSQIPQLDTEQNISNEFWERYVAGKEKEGYRFVFGNFGNTKQTFAVIRGGAETKEK